ncbi:MAG: HEAT repeat domain-containing protein, partial [SAR324 cluster bacterium]|nr:HEAT repeat domain-containing protein [SAR324 cluster bacterium]
MLVLSGPYINQTVQAFFEDQVKYKFVHHWYPMLSDSSPEKRFKAARAFLSYPEWSLPLLRNAIMNPDSENVSWQIAMLIGMLGDSTDVPPLLKIWRELGVDENSPIWLGAMQRLYWKSRGPDPRTPVLKNLVVN